MCSEPMASGASTSHDVSPDHYERSLGRRFRWKRRLIWTLVSFVLVCLAWFGWTMRRYRLPEVSPLEIALTVPLADFQVSWFRLLTTEDLAADGQRDELFEEATHCAGDLLVALRQIDKNLVGPFRELTWLLLRLPRDDLPLADTRTDIRKLLAPINLRLTTHTPRFFLDLEPFQGTLQGRFLSAYMLIVYEVLDELRFHAEFGPQNPIVLMVVRRRDALDRDPSLRGYVRREDGLAAFVLQDNATSFVATHILPAAKDPQHFFHSRFPGLSADSLEPINALLEQAIEEVRSWSGADRETFSAVADLAARRSALYAPMVQRGGRLGISLLQPDGLVWPASFVWYLTVENAAVSKQGTPLAAPDLLEELIAATRQLESGEASRILRATAAVITFSVGIHEARHVLDIRARTPVSRMAKRFGGTALEDQEYVLVLDRELRAYLTQLIESPRTTWLTLLELVSHLYGDEGSVYRDVAVLLVPGLISGGSRPTMDVEPETIDGWVSQLLSLTDEEIRRRAIGFFETNLGPYVPMRSIDEPAAP